MKNEIPGVHPLMQSAAMLMNAHEQNVFLAIRKLTVTCNFFVQYGRMMIVDFNKSVLF